jgi:phosphopantothenoylcysteine decarboxylase/phosphopantothenate--cysteine ligase
MGWALAAAARAAGARVTVVSGPTALEPPPGVAVVPVVTALEMRRETLKRSRAAAVLIGAAAVSDWRIARTAAHKIKRAARPLRLTLIPNPDIIREAAARRRPGQIFVGFALETRRAAAYAREKLVRKGLDLVVANGADTLASGRIAATLVAKQWTRRLPTGSKARVAKVVVAEIARLFNERRT